jgi:hypothetical protein
MSFFNTNAKPARSKRPLGIDERRTAQHEQGNPVPVWWGTQRIGVTMLTEPFNRIVKPANGQKKAGKTPGDNYAAVAFVLGHGPLDVLREIWVDEDLWWTGSLERGVGEDSVAITIDDFGSGTLYWGTETQTTDATLDALGIGHPAYRGIAYMVFPSAFLGQSRDTVPHFEVVASRWGLFPEFWYGVEAANGNDVNPMSPVIEVLTNPRLGRGLVNTDLIDVAGIGNVYTALDAEGFSMSPILDTQTTLRQFFADIAEYIDGWFRTDGLGRVTWGLFRNAGAGGPMLSESTMLGEPVLRPGSWLDTSSVAQVSYTNSARYWMPEVVLGVDAANATITGITKQPVYERRWVTDPVVAARLADVLAQRNGRPWTTGTLLLRPSKVSGIAPGGLYRISYGHLGLTGQQIRIVSVDTPDPGRPEVSAEITFDVGLLNGVYAEPAAYVAPDSTVLTPVVATYEDLWELPSVLGGSDRYPVVALLCAQPSLASDSFYGHIEVTGGAYDPLVPELTTAFSVRAKAKTSAGTSGNFDIELMGVDTDLSRFTAADFTEGRVVVWLGIEAMIATDFTLVSAGRYTLTLTRGAYGTTATAVAVNDPVWLVQNERLYTREIVTDTSLSVTIKIQPAIRHVAVDLASCSPLTITVDPDNIAPLPPTSLEALGSGAPTWVGTDDIPITWVATETFGPVAVVLEFWDPAGPTLVATVNLPVGSVDYTWPYATAVAALGGTPITFEIHAMHRSGTLTGASTDITVTR